MMRYPYGSGIERPSPRGEKAYGPTPLPRVGRVGIATISAHTLPWLLAGLVWQMAFAAPLYKWVDRAGQVTYSSSPPPAGTRARAVDLPPQPSAEETRQAAARMERMRKLAGELETRRLEQEAEEARLRAMRQPPPAPVVIETPVYIPQPIYYPPVRTAPRRHHDKPRHPPR